jgi:hypothetical protein
MNILLLISGCLAAFMVVGHSTIGKKQFFDPMLEADFDPTSKRIMTFVWHMSTVSLLAATSALIYAGLIAGDGPAMRVLAVFVGIQFLVIGALHLSLVATSHLPGAVYKQFQWILFFAVGLTAIMGS